METEALFTAAHAALLRLASSYTIGEYLLPVLIARWKHAHPRSHVLLDIANTHDVFERVASFRSDIGFIEGTHSHPELSVSKWRSDEIVVVAAAGHPLAERRAGARQLNHATWVLREPGSGTREASDRWLIPHLTQMEVELELGSNEAIKRVVAAGLLHLPAGADFALCALQAGAAATRAGGDQCALRLARSRRRWTAVRRQPVPGSRLRRRLRTMFSAGGIGLKLDWPSRNGARFAVKGAPQRKR